MNKQFMLSLSVVMAVHAAGASQIWADPVLCANIGHEHSVLEIAPIFPDGMLGEYTLYDERQTTYDSIVFDAFEVNFATGQPANGLAQGGFDPICSSAPTCWDPRFDPCFDPDIRWYGMSISGTLCRFAEYVRRIASVRSLDGGDIQDHYVRALRVGFAPFPLLAIQSSEREQEDLSGFYMAVRIYRGAPGCSNPDEGMLLGGAAFRVVGENLMPREFSWVYVDLAENCIDLWVPNGEFAYDIAFYGDPGLTQYRNSTQSVLWTPKDPSSQGEVLSSSIYELDLNSAGTPTWMCQTYLACGTTLVPAAAFYSESLGDQPCLRLVVDSQDYPLRAGDQVTVTITDPSGPTSDTVALLWSNMRCPTGPGSGCEINRPGLGWCADLCLTLPADPRDQMICEKQLVNGTTTCTFTIPCDAEGQRYYLRAAKKNTCPDSCVSNIVGGRVGAPLPGDCP